MRKFLTSNNDMFPWYFCKIKLRPTFGLHVCACISIIWVEMSENDTKINMRMYRSKEWSCMYAYKFEYHDGRTKGFVFFFRKTIFEDNLKK